MAISERLTIPRIKAGLERRARRVLKRSRPEDIRWFHSIELPQGTTDGAVPNDRLKKLASMVFAHPVANKTVLDIGAWDGFFSFEAERRGASDVLSIDWPCWGGMGWGTKAGYDHAHRELKSRCRSFKINLFDLDSQRFGQFDVVLFMGVFYHLIDPYGGMRKAAAMCRDHLIVETVTKGNDDPRPLMLFEPGFANDPSNYWLPNLACVESMLANLDFGKIEISEPRGSPERPRFVIHAWRN